MKQLPTAEDFLEKKYPEFEDLDNGSIWANIEETMIEFAQIHVKEALDKVNKKAKITTMRQIINGTDYSEHYINPQSVYDAYPLENIK
jgi:hypothetical protein